jgi:hypothetical protein
MHKQSQGRRKKKEVNGGSGKKDRKAGRVRKREEACK